MRAPVFVLHCSILGAASVSFAGTQDDAVIALHGQPASRKDPCAAVDPNEQGFACSDYVVNHLPLNSPTHVYLVVARADPEAGIAGVSVGIDYDPTLVALWTRCSDLGRVVGRAQGPVGRE